MLDRRRFLALAASSASLGAGAPGDTMDDIAVRYVRLILAAGVHDPDYVDAYYGPAQWKEEAAKAKMPLAAIRREASALADRLADSKPASSDAAAALRRRYLLV